MHEATRLAGEATSRDPATGLRAVAALRRLLDTLERIQVDNARGHGWSWKEIAEALGVTKQAVHLKHAKRFRSTRRR
ncbi:MAG TPA: helix-turn-helix domain-containing protein [Actinomycetota bacterium]|nr:helix-turn-helix domain-containing protein [Actinomycetota bacterium]